MWTALHIGICLVFLVLAAFWAGKKIGQRRFYKMQEEMKALELSFKNLMEDMEMVSSHNLKILETRSEEIKELVTIVDRKSFYVNDLLKELDESAASMKIRNVKITGNPAVEENSKRKYNEEIQANFDDVFSSVLVLSDRVNELENSQEQRKADSIKELVTHEVSVQLQEMLASGTEEEFPILLEQQPEKAGNYSILQHPTSPPLSTGSSFSTSPSNVKELIISPISEDLQVTSIDFDSTERLDIANKPSSSVSFLVGEVLKLYQDGITLPQIARSLNMSKTEIEFIIKIYGKNVKLRSIADVS